MFSLYCSLFKSKSNMGTLEDRATCGSLLGFHIVLGATRTQCRREASVHTAEQNKRFGFSAALEPEWIRLVMVVTMMAGQ